MTNLKLSAVIAQAVTVFAFVGCTHAPKFASPVSKDPAIFVAHTADKPMQSYLSMNLPYAPYRALREQIEKHEGVELKNRGEAHITVITPIEFDQVLKRKLSIDKIHNMAAESNLQDTKYEAICVGKGAKDLDGANEKTYFVVVKSEGLLDLRTKIQKAFVAAGGPAADFLPENFYPHVTLGYTKRDLHYEDGIRKDDSSCKYRF